MANDKQVLIIEDDPEIAGLLRIHLGDAGYCVQWKEDGESGLAATLAGNFALVILDVMLPGKDGLAVCQQIRQAGQDVPVLMLTAKTEEIDKVIGLELGADDYLTKPFGVRELVARVRALLRRMEREAPERPAGLISLGGLELHTASRRVRVRGVPVELTAKEFDLLAYFLQHPGVAFSRDQLLSRVWGYSFSGYEHTVNSHINRLRAKIEEDPSHPRFILTVWGIGYRLAEAAELEA